MDGQSKSLSLCLHIRHFFYRDIVELHLLRDGVISLYKWAYGEKLERTGASHVLCSSPGIYQLYKHISFCKNGLLIFNTSSLY